MDRKYPKPKPDHKLPPLDVEKRLLKVEKVIGETLIKKVVDTTVVLPITAEKVFDVVASATNVNGEVREGGVLVTGVIKKQLFIVDEGDLVRHVPEEIPFRQFIQVEGARPGLNVQVRVTVDDVTTNLIDNGKKVRQEVLLEIFVKVTETEQIEVVTGVTGGPSDLAVEKKKLKVDSVVGEDLVSEVVKNKAELPITAKKIFQVVGEVRDVETEVRNDVVIVKGIVHKQIFLVDEGDVVRHVAEDVPFNIPVTIPGARPGFDVQVDVDAIVDRFDLVDPPSKVLRQTIVLDIFVKVTEMLQIDVVLDVTGTGIEAVTQFLKVEQVVADVVETTTVEAAIDLPMKAEKIFRIMSEIVDVETEILNGRVIVRGVLHKQIFFVDMGGLLRHDREDVPFQVAAAVPGAEPGLNVQVRLRIIGDVDFNLVKNRRLEQTAVIEAYIKLTRTEQLDVVVDVLVKDVPVKPKPPVPPKKDFVIVKKGDTLFLIAKRLGVSLDELIAANPQIKDPNRIFPGQKVFIPSTAVDPHPEPDPEEPTTRVYVVQSGDTLFKIAQRFSVTIDAILAINPQIKDPDVLHVGQKILIPVK